MSPAQSRRRPPLWSPRLASALLVIASAVSPAQQQPQPSRAPAPRPMTFLDVQYLRQIGSTEVSPDGRWLLYTLSIPDWKNARRESDIYLVSTEQGLASTRQMTFTKDKNETAPRWARDGSFFVFASNRDAPAGGGAAQGQPSPASPPAAGAGATQNQLY